MANRGRWGWWYGRRPWAAPLAVLAALRAGPLRAQTVTPAETITAEVLGRHLQVLAADSLQGRDTPSPSFDRAARYLAAQFQHLGLKPAGDSGTWFQRYPVPLRIDFARAHVAFTAGGQTAVASLTTAGPGSPATTSCSTCHPRASRETRSFSPRCATVPPAWWC